MSWTKRQLKPPRARPSVRSLEDVRTLPMIGDTRPEVNPGYLKIVFCRTPPGGRFVRCCGLYTREFLAKGQPFVVSRSEYETYLRETGLFKEVT